MKTFLCLLALTGMATVASAQGTIAPLNSALTRMMVIQDDGVRYVRAPDYSFSIYVFYGPSADELVRAPAVGRIGTTDGVMIGFPSVMPLPGTEPGQIVSLQIRACSPLGFYGETDVRQVTLGPTEGPGTPIWQTHSGMNPNRFTPLVASRGGNPDLCIPEPSTWALGALFGASFLFRLRKITKPN